MKASTTTKVIGCKSEQSFSLGLDSTTLGQLRRLQVLPEFILRDQKTPSRTLVTRLALRVFSKSVTQAKSQGKTDWLLEMNLALQQLAQQGKKGQA
jgi:hypothetical protein